MFFSDHTEVILWQECYRKDVPFSSALYRGAKYQNMLLLVTLTLITWLKWYLPGFSAVKLFFSPL